MNTLSLSYANPFFTTQQKKINSFAPLGYRSHPIKDTVFLRFGNNIAGKRKGELDKLYQSYMEPLGIPELQHAIDLPEAEKEYLIDKFKSETGFPAPEAITAKFDNTLKDCLTQVEQKQNCKAVYSAYDRNCSLGQNVALPYYSDVDHWITVFNTPEDVTRRGQVVPNKVEAKRENIKAAIKSELSGSLIPEAEPEVIFMWDVERIKQLAIATDKMNQTERLSYIRRLRQTDLPDESALKFLALYAKEGREIIHPTGKLTAMMQEREINDFKTNPIVTRPTGKQTKGKYQARQLLFNQFESLSTDEQLTVVLLLLSRSDTSPISSTNPMLDTLYSLLDKRLITYRNFIGGSFVFVFPFRDGYPDRHGFMQPFLTLEEFSSQNPNAFNSAYLRTMQHYHEKFPD